MRGRVVSATHHRRGSGCMRDDGTTDFERSDRIAAARKRYRLWSWTTLTRGVMVTLILEIDRAEYAAIPAGETPRFSAALGTIAPANCCTQGPWRFCRKAPHQDRYRYGNTRNRRGRDPVKFAHSSPCELAFKLHKLRKNSRKLVRQPLGP